MERFARRSLFVTLRVVVVLGLAGCSNQQRTSANPFMAPDRVPPPATRTIAPGTAQPYYPGDPVPAAQTGAPAAAVMAQTPAPPATSVPAAAVAAVPAAMSAAPTQTPEPLAFSNERTVSIPNDKEDLRFAVPAPPTVADPLAQTPGIQAPAAAPAMNQFAAAPQSLVVPTAYSQGVASQPMPAAGPPTAASENLDGNPWRSPLIPGANSGVMQAQYVQPPSTQPTMLAAQGATMQPAVAQPSAAPSTMATQPMPLQLRSVPGSTTAPMMVPAPGQPTQMQMSPAETSPPPRMRFPSWTDPTTWFTPQTETASAGQQQLVGYMVPGPNGTQQMISVEQYQAMYGGGQQPTLSTATTDGFRARGTATK